MKEWESEEKTSRTRRNGVNVVTQREGLQVGKKG